MTVLYGYSVVWERPGDCFGAYVPDLPGCITVGDSQLEIEGSIREAVLSHLAAMRKHGETIPKPRTATGFVEVPGEFWV